MGGDVDGTELPPALRQLVGAGTTMFPSWRQAFCGSRSRQSACARLSAIVYRRDHHRIPLI